MNWIETKNLQPVELNKIPNLDIENFLQAILSGANSNWRVVQFYGRDTEKGILLTAVMADDETARLYLTSTLFTDRKSYESLTPKLPSLQLFEREFYEQFKIEPLNHPWLKPVRKGIAGVSKKEKPYEFFTMEGEEVHEVGVGPIHAGVIEPGHFRFLCTGEEVHHLEIQNGFQHRGVENLIIKNREKSSFLLHLAESISGDSVIAHAGTYVRGIEALSATKVSLRAQQIRTIALELERIGIHLGDLSALAGDVAYLTGNSVFGALRTRVINTSLSLCGSRFGRGLLTLGGVNFDINAVLHKTMISSLAQIHKEIELAVEVMFSDSSLLARFEKAGVVTNETAQKIGMVGPAARASGMSLDLRCDHPVESYNNHIVHKLVLHDGDVFSRAYIRALEIKQSFMIIQRLLSQINPREKPEILYPVGKLSPSQLVISLTEGWRGEVAHVIVTNENSKLAHYKIKDPSFHNWLALAMAVRNNGISDFPICNKSFNLSYCGVDL